MRAVVNANGNSENKLDTTSRLLHDKHLHCSIIMNLYKVTNNLLFCLYPFKQVLLLIKATLSKATELWIA